MPHLIIPYHTSSTVFDRKLLLVTTLKLVPRFSKRYHTLSPMFDRKLISVTTSNVVLKLLKKLPHLVTFYYILSLMFDRKLFSVATVNLVVKPLKSYHIFSQLIMSYHTKSHFTTHPPSLLDLDLINALSFS